MSGDRARHIIDQTVAKVDDVVDRLCGGDALVQIGVMMAVGVTVMGLILILAHVLLWIGRL
jgi:hypothetical protein